MNIHGYQPSAGLTPAANLNETNETGKAASTGSDNFATLLKAYTEQVNHDVKAAASSAENLAAGEGGNTSET
ncbi:MAG: flagellar hook-basal body complex protein FliE, partial [Mariprofundus sp.]